MSIRSRDGKAKGNVNDHSIILFEEIVKDYIQKNFNIILYSKFSLFPLKLSFGCPPVICPFQFSIPGPTPVHHLEMSISSLSKPQIKLSSSKDLPK